MNGNVLGQIIHQMPGNTSNNDHKTITVRMPPELHAILVAEAKQHRTSVNRLAIAKLAIKAELLDKVAANPSSYSGSTPTAPPIA